jgi:phospholipid/cholesterol/gamma-HCH transport system ATP-binding protein
MSARGIVNRFGEQTVHDGIDLDISSGEILGIAGGSGSGKSVLLRTLAGLNRPQAGSVLAGGKPIASLPPAERAAFMGMLFQHGALFSSLTVEENVMLPMREHTRLSPKEQATRAATKLSLVGLDAGARAKFPAALSGGMIKRAALARALALDPRLLLLDEATSGLDPSAADEIDQLILLLNQTLRVTVVMVTHDVNSLFGICDRVAILADGKLTVGTPQELMHATQSGVRQFLSGPRVEVAMAEITKIQANKRANMQRTEEQGGHKHGN